MLRIEVEFVYPPRQMPRDLQISLDERAVDRLTVAHLLLQDVATPTTAKLPIKWALAIK